MRTFEDEGSVDSPVVEMLTLVKVKGRRGLHASSSSDGEEENDGNAIHLDDRDDLLANPSIVGKEYTITIDDNDDGHSNNGGQRRGRVRGASLDGVPTEDAIEEQKRAEQAAFFEILQKFDVDRMRDLLATRNWDLLYAYNEMSERLTDLIQRERSIADLSAEEMAFLEAKQSWVDTSSAPLDELLQSLGANVDSGLSDAEAEARLAQHAINRLSSLKSASKLGFYLKHLVQGPSALWWLAATLCFIVAVLSSSQKHVTNTFTLSLVLGCTLVVLSFLSGSLAYWFQPRPPLLKRRLLTIYPRHAKALRNGRYQRIDVEQLVPGDIVQLRIGDRVPADLRMLSCAGMYVSRLSGEQGVRHVSVQAGADNAENPLDAASLVLYGTNCVEGSGVGVVVRTGDRTILGTLCRDMQVTKEIPTFLQRDTSPLFVAFFVVTLSLLTVALLVHFYLTGNYALTIDSGIVIILAFLPSGLMISGYLLSLVGGVYVNRLRLRVQQLNSLELLGRTSVLLCDKTGFLTDPTATVTGCYLDGGSHDLRASHTDVASRQAFRELIRAVALLDKGPEHDGGNGDKAGGKDVGDVVASKRNDDNDDDDDDDDDYELISVDHRRQDRATVAAQSGLLTEERALLELAAQHTDVAATKRSHAHLYAVPFAPPLLARLTISRCRASSSSSSSSSVGEGARLLVVRTGTPAAILEVCTTVLSNGDVRELFDEERAEILRFARNVSSMGEKAVAFCQLYLNPYDFPNDFDFDMDAANFPLTGFCFLGLLSVYSEPKPSSRDLVNHCRNAGIRVVMITEDEPLAAAAVARQLNIVLSTSRTVDELAIEEGCAVEDIDPERAGASVLLGDQLRRMADAQLDAQIRRGSELIFAQTSSHQKNRIVQAFQRTGYMVAVTGANATDSPALNKADVGIARHKLAASPVAVHASDFLLETDEFADLVAGVAESRRFGTNLKKFFAFSLSNKMAQILPSFLFIFFSLPMPLSGLPILVLDCVCTVAFAISFAFEPMETGTMLRPPDVRPNRSSIINGRLLSFSFLQIGVVQAFATIFTYITVLSGHGFSLLHYNELADFFADVNYSIVVDGVVWSYDARMALLGQVHSAVFITMIFLQIVNLFSIRSQTTTLFHPSIIANPATFVSVVLSLAICAVISYVPGLNTFLWTAPIAAVYWFTSLPFVAILLLFHELRKLWIRNRPTAILTEHLLF